MSQGDKENRAQNAQKAQQLEEVNVNRRRLAKASVGVPAVMATLASRPVFANACSVSGMQSGNASPQPGQLPCGGCTPGFWQANAIHKGASAWPCNNPSTSDPDFNVLCPNTLITAVPGINVTSVSKYKLCSGGDMTLLNILNLKGNEDPYCPNIGMHFVAGLLNTVTFKKAGSDYGYTPLDLVNMFNNRGDCEAFKNMLDMLNNRGCPLGQNGPTQTVDPAVCCQGTSVDTGGGGGRKPPKNPK